MTAGVATDWRCWSGHAPAAEYESRGFSESGLAAASPTSASEAIHWSNSPKPEKRHLSHRRLAEQGQDPRGGGVPTFAEAAENVIQLYSKGWKPGSKTEHRWRSTLKIYAYPTLGSKRVDRITTADVMGLLGSNMARKEPHCSDSETGNLGDNAVGDSRGGIGPTTRPGRPSPRRCPSTAVGLGITRRCPIVRSRQPSSRYAGRVPTRPASCYSNTRSSPQRDPQKPGSRNGSK